MTMNNAKSKREILVYTDGSCSGNGRTDAIGGIGIYFPNKELKNISQIFRFESCTNQKTELYAILTTLRYINKILDLKKCKVTIKTDSKYCIDCVTKWVNGWKKNNWTTQNGNPVANREFIEKIHNYYEKYDIEFEHIEAHTGRDDFDSICNSKADKLATMATERARNNSNNNVNLKTNSSTSKHHIPRPFNSYLNGNFTNGNYSNNIDVKLVSVPDTNKKTSKSKTSKINQKTSKKSVKPKSSKSKYRVRK